MIQSYYSRYGEVKGGKRGRDSFPLLGELLRHHRGADQFAPGAGIAAGADPAGSVAHLVHLPATGVEVGETNLDGTGSHG